MKKKIFVFLAVLIVLSFIPMASLYAEANSISYIGAAWDIPSPTVYVTLQKGIDSSYKTAAFDAVNIWMAKLGSNFSYTPVDSSTKKNPAKITITIKKNTGNILGTTRISSAAGNLTGISITMASQNAMGKPLEPVDFKNILMHELGHAFGLGHANDDGIGLKDLMYPYYDFTTVGYAVPPSDFDISALLAIYTSDGFAGDNNAIPSVYTK